MSTHNLCFRAKIRKNVYPCKPQFYYVKVGCKGSTLHGHVFMILSKRGLHYQIHCYFLLGTCENLLQYKRFSHLSTKK